MILNEELFILPYNGNYLLYLPKNGNVLEVNQGVVNLLRNINQNNKELKDIDNRLLSKLKKAGVFVEEAPIISKGSENVENVTQEFKPEGLSLFLTSECNMRCIYCYADGGASQKTLSWNTAKSAMDFLLDNARKNKRKEVYLHFHGGGEVTTRLDLMKKCTDYFKKSCGDMIPRIGAGINGYMNERTLTWVANNLDDITISFDGIKEIQNLHRPLNSGMGSFDKVVQCIKELDSRRVKYGLRMTVTNESLPYLTESVKFMSNSFDCEIIQAEPFFKVGRAEANDLNSVDPVKFVQEFRKSWHIANEAGVMLTYSGARFEVLTDIFCKACSNSMGVTTDGYLSSCYEITEKKDERSKMFFYGKYNTETKGFDIDYAKLNRLHKLSVDNKELCENCFCKWHCAGDCPAKQATFGDPWNPVYNERCYITQELTKDQLVQSLKDKSYLCY